MFNLKKTIYALLLAFPVYFASSANAISNCENAEIISEKLIENFCFSCIFPIRIAGADIGSGDYPDGRMTEAICWCPRGPFGMMVPGLPTGQWIPNWIIEQTRTAGCSLALGGIDIGDFGKTFGSVGQENSRSNHGDNQRHYRYYKFPLGDVIGLLPWTPATGWGAFGLLGMSELIDPGWYEDEVSHLLAPDTTLVASVASQASCAIDSASVNAGGKPNNSLYWCSGSWGTSLPMTSAVDSGLGIIQGAASQDVRVLARGHRLGIFEGTVGGGRSACRRGRYQPILPKQQYKMQMYYPTAEKTSNHWIGENEVRWGVGKYRPGKEDQVTIVWQWIDYCR